MLHTRRQGFTLIELVSVIAIIALLVGMIVVGQTMIASSKLQSIIVDQQRYKEAIRLFKEKYQEMPGDMPTAETLWGSDASCPSTSPNNVVKKATCNGNGDGFITDSSASPYTAPTHYVEMYRAWQHLANGGFIPGPFTGTSSPGTGDVGIHTAASRWSKLSQFNITYAYPGAGSYTFAANYRHVLVFGLPASGSASDLPSTGALSATEAKFIDDKIDDGSPSSGNVLTFETNINNCAKNPASNLYNITGGNTACGMIFITGL